MHLYHSLLLLLVAASASEQPPPAYMGVCHYKDTSSFDVQSFCQSTPDCMHASTAARKDPSQLECFMRCQDEELETNQLEWNCAKYGMTCHTGLVCTQPSLAVQDEESMTQEHGGVDMMNDLANDGGMMMDTNSNNNDNDDDFSPGIIVGILLVMAVTAVALWWARRRRQERLEELYSKTTRRGLDDELENDLELPAMS